jgi:hypothetical protein
MLREALPKIVTPLPGPKAKEILDRRAAAVPGAIGCAYKAVILEAKALCSKTLMETTSSTGSAA